jgi:hypothetical protein
MGDQPLHAELAHVAQGHGLARWVLGSHAKRYLKLLRTCLATISPMCAARPTI